MLFVSSSVCLSVAVAVYFTIYPSLFLETETHEFSDKASKMAVHDVPSAIFRLGVIATCNSNSNSKD